MGGREPSSLDGVPCGSVAIARGVDVFAAALDQPNDNSVVRADIATIGAAFNPRVDMLLEHPTEGRMRLTRLLQSNGFSRRFIVVHVVP